MGAVECVVGCNRCPGVDELPFSAEPGRAEPRGRGRFRLPMVLQTPLEGRYSKIFRLKRRKVKKASDRY